MSVNAARKSACATGSGHAFYSDLHVGRTGHRGQDGEGTGAVSLFEYLPYDDGTQLARQIEGYPRSFSNWSDRTGAEWRVQ